MRTDRQTDVTKPIVAFRNVVKAPKKENGRSWKNIKKRILIRKFTEENTTILQLTRIIKKSIRKTKESNKDIRKEKMLGETKE
jgi:hypothetical protein